MSIEDIDNPFDLFAVWYAEAENIGIKYPNAMSLSTVSGEKRPSLRIVLLKGYDDRGFVFYTNLNSRKGLHINDNNHAALCFYWMEIGKQIRIEGDISMVSSAEADEYFATRPRDSQIGAWASKQSQRMEDRDELKRRFVEKEEKYAGQEVPRPQFWSGYRLIPQRMEFWLEQPFRLHERKEFMLTSSGWVSHYLFP